MESYLLIFVVIIFLATLWVIFAQLKLGKRMTMLFTGSGARNVEQLLAEYLGKVRKSEKEIARINSVLTTHASHLTKSVQKVGFVRFNPFEDTGGDQSFSIALLDQKDSGVVLTSMHGRAGTRVYAKPVEGGKSSHNLSNEEKQAIEQALKRAEV